MAATAVRRDLAAGGVLTAFGALTAWESSRYAFGTLGRMGPGYYPALLGGGMMVVGLLIVLNRGGAEAGLDEGPPPLDWRGAGCIVAGVLAFLGLGAYAGFAPATFACVVIAALGDRTASVRGSAVLALGATVLGMLVFSYALQMPLPLWRPS